MARAFLFIYVSSSLFSLQEKPLESVERFSALTTPEKKNSFMLC